MKNKQGIVLAPLLIIIGAVIVAGFTTYMLIQNSGGTKSENENITVVNQANTNSNTNSTTDTNQVANNNANTNASKNINTPITQPLTPKSVPAGWKTFLSTNFDNSSIRAKLPSMAFAYPPQFTIDANIDTIALYSSPGDTTQGYINVDWGRTITGAKSPDAQCDEVIRRQYANYTVEESKTITIDDNPAKLMRLLLNADNGQFKTTIVCSVVEGKSFGLIANPDTSSSFNSNLETLLQTVNFSD